jgi:AraC-like DNA-binding protein
MTKKISNKDVLELYYPKTILPEIPVLGWQRFGQATPGGARPSKLQTFEICYVDSGSVEWWIDNTLFEAGAKSLFINKPGEWHGGESGFVQPCEMYFLQFMFPPEGKLPGLARDTRCNLQKHFESIRGPFSASAEIKFFFDLLLKEQRTPQLHSLTLARAAFHQLLISTVRDYQQQGQPKYSEGIRQSLVWIQQHLEHDLYTEDLAQGAAMSVAQFYKRFTLEVGLTPNDYHVHQRIIAAKHALRNTSQSITEIALQLGMSSSQYFATVFKKIVGITPTDYRALRHNQPRRLS